MRANQHIWRVVFLFALGFWIFVSPLLIPLSAQSTPWVSAYYPGYEQSYLPADSIDFTAVTHIMHHSLLPQTNGDVDSLTHSLTGANVASIIQKAHGAGKKVLIVVGGATTETGFHGATNSTYLGYFIHNIKLFVDKYNYDGVDIDWEPLNTVDSGQYSSFIVRLRDTLTTAKFLTAAIIWTSNNTLLGMYGQLQSKFDQMNLQTYNLSGPYQGWAVWHNSAVYRTTYTNPNTCGWNSNLVSVHEIDSTFSVAPANIPRSKLGIGIPFEGQKWTMGFLGCVNYPVTQMIRETYSNIMSQYYVPSQHRWYSDDRATGLEGNSTYPYISYDDQRSVTEKMNYVKNQGLGGTIIWELGEGYRSTELTGFKDCLLKSVKAAALNPSMIISSTIANNWNLVSVPNVVRNLAGSTVWPGKTSGPFGYNGSYQLLTQVENGAGYWVKYSRDTTKNDTGGKITSLCIPVISGWNMIGSLSRPLARSKITSSPSGIVISKYFGYNGSYYVADTLDPGKGYWVKTSAAGTLGLDTASTANNPPSPSNEQPPCMAGSAPSPPSSLTVFRISACDGLYHPKLNWVASGSVCVQNYNIHRQDCDALGHCFAPGVIATVASSVLTYTDCQILYGTGLSPGQSCTSTYWVTAVDVWGDESSSTNTVTVNTATCFAQKTAGTGGTEGNTQTPVPTKTSLQGSYPNPFNPTCVIRYALSEDAQVSLKVFNVFGQEVITLVDEFQAAGFRSINFDARSLPSGVYFYRLRAGKFVDVKKMVLTK